MLKFSRYVLTLAALSAGGLLANNHPAPGSWEVSGSFLYLRPSVDDTFFVIDSPVTTTFPNGERLNNDCSFKPGFRVGAVYSFCDCGEVEFSYSHLGASHNRLHTGEFLWATVGRADFAATFENYSGAAFAHSSYTYNQADLVYGQSIWDCCGLNVYVNLGIDYAYLRLEERHVYEITGGASGTAQEIARLSGVGPEFGFALDYELMKCDSCFEGVLSITGKSSGSLLAAAQNYQGYNSVSGADILSIRNEESWRIVPSFHMALGLNYAMTCGCYEGFLEIGYEFTSYIRGLSRVAFPDDVADGLCYNDYYNYDLQGLYVQLSVGF